MCIVSDKLKLCTCENAGNLKHFWVLHRFVAGKKGIIMGQPVLPALIDPEIEKLNEALLLKLLNEGNAFDEPIHPIKNDRLHLCFRLGDDEDLDYGFLYNGTFWERLDYDVFGWYTKHDEIDSGKIKNALKE